MPGRHPSSSNHVLWIKNWDTQTHLFVKRAGKASLHAILAWNVVTIVGNRRISIVGGVDGRIGVPTMLGHAAIGSRTGQGSFMAGFGLNMVRKVVTKHPASEGCGYGCWPFDGKGREVCLTDVSLRFRRDGFIRR